MIKGGQRRATTVARVRGWATGPGYDTKVGRMSDRLSEHFWTTLYAVFMISAPVG
jgi:hypothetical protein